MALPLPLRNRLVELILDSLHDPAARSVLGALVRFCDGGSADALPELLAGFPAALRPEHGRFRDELCEHARRAWGVLRDRPLAAADPGLPEVLAQAAELFDARLFFEVHELLEPSWLRAEGAVRDALQGLIQIAVGFHHLSNGNVDGARALLDEGSARADGKTLGWHDLGPFVSAVREALGAVVVLGPDASRAFDWSRLPRFPRES